MYVQPTKWYNIIIFINNINHRALGITKAKWYASSSVEMRSNMDGRTKYAVMVDDIQAAIATGLILPGDKISSENELAAHYQVSRHTVRKALSILEQEGYLEAVHGVGTFCRKKTKMTGTSKNIAVVTTYISDYIFPRVIQGIDGVLTENGYSIILKNTGNSRANERKILEELLQKGIDGLIIEPSKSQIMCRNIDLYEKLEEFRIPYVFIQGSYMQLRHKPHILMNDEKGGYLLTNYLIRTGHKHLIGIFKADDSQGEERHKGFARALREHNIPYNPEQVIWFHTEDRTSKPTKSLEYMLETEVKMDGIVCYNDMVAFDVAKFFMNKGIRIPEDISITGYDNMYNTENSILQLTTIAHPQEVLGEMAATLMLEQMEGVPLEKSKVKRIIEPELIIRNSCMTRS